MSDWIMAATGIPAITPELGNNNTCSETFYIDSLDCITDVLNDNFPLTMTYFKKIGSQLDFKTTFKPVNETRTEVDLTITNKGLSIANDNWVTINALNATGAPADFTLLAAAAYDPYNYDSDSRGKQIKFKQIRRNSDFSYSIQLPDVNTRRHITVELVADMKNVASLELIYKEYNTDVI